MQKERTQIKICVIKIKEDGGDMFDLKLFSVRYLVSNIRLTHKQRRCNAYGNDRDNNINKAA